MSLRKGGCRRIKASPERRQRGARRGLAPRGGRSPARHPMALPSRSSRAVPGKRPRGKSLLLAPGRRGPVPGLAGAAVFSPVNQSPVSVLPPRKATRRVDLALR